METLEDRGDPNLTSASLTALLPAEHLVDREAFTPKTIDQGATYTTWPRFMDAIKTIPICQQPIKLFRTGLSEELEDPEESEPEKLEEPGDPTTKEGVAELEPEELEAPGDLNLSPSRRDLKMRGIKSLKITPSPAVPLLPPTTYHRD